MATKRICEVGGCEKPYHAKGFCSNHYHRMKKFGFPFPPARKKAKNGVTRLCSVNGCKGVHKGHGFCENHLNKYKKYGDPLGGSTPQGALITWLIEHVSHKGDECLMWPFGKNQKGYGAVKFEGRMTSASRAMCILAHGRPPKGKNIAAHSCGNGHLGCTNPKHLRWATEEENRKDDILHKKLRIGRYAEVA